MNVKNSTANKRRRYPQANVLILQSNFAVDSLTPVNFLRKSLSPLVVSTGMESVRTFARALASCVQANRSTVVVYSGRPPAVTEYKLGASPEIRKRPSESV